MFPEIVVFHLSKGAEAKLRAFILNFDGKVGENLGFIVLGTECFLVTITRFKVSDSDTRLYVITRYRVDENGVLKKFQTEEMRMEKSLRWLRCHVSTRGAQEFEEVVSISSDPGAAKLQSAMLTALNRDIYSERVIPLREIRPLLPTKYSITTK